MELDAEFTCPVGEGSDSDSDSDTDRTSDSEFCKSDDDMGVNTWTMSGYPIGRGCKGGGFSYWRKSFNIGFRPAMNEKIYDFGDDWKGWCKNLEKNLNKWKKKS